MGLTIKEIFEKGPKLVKQEEKTARWWEVCEGVDKFEPRPEPETKKQ